MTADLPPPGAVEVEAAGEHLWLLPERAAYWLRLKTLLIADAHFGKAAAFRRAGVPVPAGTTEENLKRLGALVHSAGARRVVFLGDMLHSRAGRESSGEASIRWRREHAAVEMLLVRGNHDRRAGDPSSDWGVEC